MQSKLLFIFLVFAAFGYSQEWRDSVLQARKYYKNGDGKKAISYYESAEKKGAKKINLTQEKAQSAYKNRDFKTAEKYYQSQLKKPQTNERKAKNYHNLGNTQFKQKKYDEAIHAYQSSLKLNPENKKTRYNLSEALRMKKNQDARNDKNQNKDNQSQCKNPNPQSNKNNNQNKGNKDKNSEANKPQKPSSIPDKETDKLLDELMKAEAKTKRKVGGKDAVEGGKTTTKDW